MKYASEPSYKKEKSPEINLEVILPASHISYFTVEIEIDKLFPLFPL